MGYRRCNAETGSSWSPLGNGSCDGVDIGRCWMVLLALVVVVGIIVHRPDTGTGVVGVVVVVVINVMVPIPGLGY